MSEEKAVYATAKGRMHELLRTVRYELVHGNGYTFNENAPIIQEIDHMLARTSPEPEQINHEDIITEIADIRQLLVTQSGGYIRGLLSELPEDIRLQSLKIAELTNNTEALRLSHANSKNSALELVLSTTEEGKSKFSNENQRKVAVEQLLRNDRPYLDNIDALSRKECEIRKEQIQLEYLQNQFRAFLAVAGMQGVRA